MKTKEQFLVPRFKVVAGYPSSNDHFKVGEILDNPMAESMVKWYEQWPHIFQRLKWWEERPVEEMPKYLLEDNGMVHKVTRYDHRNSLMYATSLDNNAQCRWLAYFLPADESDYLTYQQSLTNSVV